jgi:Ulp1 family protease
LSGFQSLSNVREVRREEFESFKSAVSPVANARARVTRTYKNDPILHQFMHATPNQVNSMWNRIHTELDSFSTDLIVRRLANQNDENRTRLPVYKEDLEGLRVGHWVGNTVIHVFAWKNIKKQGIAGVPTMYNRFRIMEGSFMHYMYDQYGKDNYNGCHCMVKMKKVDSHGHVMSFMSHKKIFVTVHKDLNHWVLFVICPADQQITIIDSLYDQGPWHVLMYESLVKFIHEYDK